MSKNKITPFLWYDKEAEDAAKFYVSIFKNAKINQVARYPEGSPYEAGTVMTVAFELDGQHFTAINGGPHFKLDEAISFTVDCDGQAEVDHYWESLLAGGGTPSQCGWLKDRYGLSWQVTPKQLIELTTSSDKAQNNRVFAAMMKMSKIIVADLERAAKA
ncbi:VOC family protein [Terricaulis silvestris]|uniref:3-demethylubiquinone-9 3-methyltransferase n=1 Tax=Terricaulis silvestris TaxID=2686094 RepID=A0A6I6MNE9_9CAUL|nr:VOC family protein [Terricaulis silvestris]QGZ94846.1 3-demethylubiquinone-9 3-methyltransferase [Terricaulis silvestris]